MRKYGVIAYIKNKSVHFLHAQTRMPIVIIQKLYRIIESDAVTPWARALAQRKIDILYRDRFQCIDCGENRCLTIDHIKEGVVHKDMRGVADGYPFDDCQTLCAWCHLQKNNNHQFINSSHLAYVPRMHVDAVEEFFTDTPSFPLEMPKKRNGVHVLTRTNDPNKETMEVTEEA